MIEYNAPGDAEDKWTRLEDIDVVRLRRFNSDAFDKGYKLRIGSTIYNKPTPKLQAEVEKEKMWAKLAVTDND